MAYRPLSKPPSISAGFQESKEAKQTPNASVSRGASQLAKAQASKWATDPPGSRSADPPFVGGRPFNRAMMEEPRSFDAWKEAFLSTDAGFTFRAPPPEPGNGIAPPPADGGVV